jgi:hypothetical protein
MITPFVTALFLIGLFAVIVEASARQRGMARAVKFFCTDVASIEVVGKAILDAHKNDEDDHSAAKRVAKPFIETGICMLFPKRTEVQLRRIMKWLSHEMATWEVESLEGRVRYALSLPVMDQLSGAKVFRPG